MRGQGGRDLHGDVERVAKRDVRAGHPLPQPLAVYALHGDELPAITGLAEGVDGANVRVIERRRGAGLLPEPHHSRRVLREVLSQYLERDGSLECDVSREPDLAHSAAPKRSHDFITLKAGPRTD